MSFPHLHVSSAYSTHYGVTMPETLADQVQAQGDDFLAVTDRDGLYGAIKHFRACTAAGIRAGLGAELAVHDDEHRPLGRVVVLAHGGMAGRGYAALCRAVSAAHTHPRTPSISRRRLASLAALRTLTVLLGPVSDIGQALTMSDSATARTRLTAWSRVMPEGSITLEVVCHLTPSGPGSVGPATRMLGLAEWAMLPAVLTNAVRYGTPGEAVTADLADSTRALTPLAELGAPQSNGQAWLKPDTLMSQVGRMVVDVGSHPPGTLPRLLADTAALADRCTLDPVTDIGLGRPRMPEAAIIGITGDPHTELWARARHGVDERYTNSPLLAEAHAALAHEMATVHQLGFASYFLTVAKACDLMRNMGVRVQARGSGVGSVLNYALHTSVVEPISNNLIWERFLSPERQTLPDIDIDVEAHRRHDIYREIFRAFGAERVSLMSMTNTYRSRGAVRDAGRALGIPDTDISAIAKQLWRFNARDFRTALEEKPELAEIAAEVQRSQQLDMLVGLTERLDRLPRHISVHPCGVILSDVSLLDRTPVQASGMGLPMSQFDKHDMDPLGLIKLDVLGVRMMSSISHAVEEHRRLTGETIDLDRIPLDDPATFDMLCSTRTLGVFQLESPGQMELIGKLQPRSFNDITVEISLFRPGPMEANMPLHYLQARHGETNPDYIDARFRPFLTETNGVVVYHEQVMRMIDALTGDGLGHADVLRRHLGKPEHLAALGDYIIGKALTRGFPRKVAERAWKVLSGFGNFGFAKAHGAAFAITTYRSAWLKQHHPAVFFAGLLTHDPGMWPKDLIIAEARNLGVTMLPLDVQHSGLQYRVEILDHGRHAIRLALGELAGSSAAERQRIAEHQPFTSLQDFRDRVRPKRRTFEALARIGALDAFIDYNRDLRGALLAHIHALTGAVQTVAGTQLAFDLDLPTPRYANTVSLELRGRTQTDLELAGMGLTVTRHQMEQFHDLFRNIGVTPASKLLDLPGGSEVLVAGVRRATHTPPMRGGTGRVVFCSLDDGTGPVTQVVFFTDTQARIGAAAFHTHYMLVRGTTRRTGARGISITGEEVWDLHDVAHTINQRTHAEKLASDTATTSLDIGHVYELFEKRA